MRRRHHAPKPVDEATMDRIRRWWLAGYSIDELLELGREIGWVEFLAGTGRGAGRHLAEKLD